MDIKMKAEDDSGDFPTWDLKTENNIVPILSGDEEDLQIATLACFLEKGSIKQLKEMGVAWATYLTGDKTFGELDAEIRESLRKADKADFVPNYQIDNDKLTLTVSREL